MCFLIVLAFSSLSISLLKQNQATDELYEALNVAIEAEQVNLIRTLLEENTDFIVREILENGAISCDAKPGEMKQKVNSTLLAYFGEMEKCCNGISIEFYSNGGKKLNLGFMNSNSSLIVKKVGNTCAIQYAFHGGAMRNEFVIAEIKAAMLSQQFMLPAGYSHKIVGVAT